MGERPARIRARPEDFFVDEIPLYPPLGEGDHTFVRVEKILRTTEQVARDLARCADVRPRDVGFAGRKDRVAVTRQWFSVPGLDPARALDLSLANARVLEAVPHRHKLRTGQLRGNHFRIRVCEVEAEVAERTRDALERIQRRGMPNRFGAQRFGRDGTNTEEGLALLTGARARVDRRTARLILSALQAAVFNEVLEQRVLELDEVAAGEVAVVHCSGGLFVVEDEGRENARAAEFEISATGPIFGSRVIEPTASAADREVAALRSQGVPPEDAWRLAPGLKLRGSRRALRVRPEGALIESAPGELLLDFTLPSGSYATVLLEELLGAAPREVG